MRKLCFPLAAFALCFVFGCESHPYPPETHRVDPARPVESANWGPTDVKETCGKCFVLLQEKAMKKLPGKKPRVMLSRIENRTNEPNIDTRLIGNLIFTEMSSSEQFDLIDAQAREDIAAEYNYQQSGYVDPSQAKGPGHQVAAEYMLRGELHSIDSPKGWSDHVYYNLTMRLTDIETGVMVGQVNAEIAKVIER